MNASVDEASVLRMCARLKGGGPGQRQPSHNQTDLLEPCMQGTQVLAHKEPVLSVRYASICDKWSRMSASALGASWSPSRFAKATTAPQSCLRPCARRPAHQSSSQQETAPVPVGLQNQTHLSELRALELLNSEIDATSFSSLAANVIAVVKVDELLDKAKSLLDKTGTRMES